VSPVGRLFRCYGEGLTETGIDQNVSLDEAAAIEPIAVAVHAVSAVACLQPHRNVVVFGAGPVGLMCMAGKPGLLRGGQSYHSFRVSTVAKAFGSRRVIGVDISLPRLEFAKEFAATDIYQSPAAEQDEPRMKYCQRVAEDMAKTLNIDLVSGSESIDYVFDCTGMEVCISTGIMLTRSSGTFVQVGLGNVFVTIP
jgi:D-xylulose reductase